MVGPVQEINRSDMQVSRDPPVIAIPKASPPGISRRRIIAAFAVALFADGLQMLLGPLGWVFLDQIIDVIAMGLTVSLIGFHLLLLPTFVIELVPVVTELPTWTACVALVLALKKRNEKAVDLDSMKRVDGV
jgi:hypothetical protein